MSKAKERIENEIEALNIDMDITAGKYERKVK